MWKSTVNDWEVCETGEIRNKHGRPLKGWNHNAGYKAVGGGSKTKHLIHRLIAEAFIPNPDNLYYVDHINGNKTDNSIENLRWTTNAQNGFNSGLSKKTHQELKGFGMINVINTHGQHKYIKMVKQYV